MSTKPRQKKMAEEKKDQEFQVGDVIRSKRFIFGCRNDEDDNTVYIDRRECDHKSRYAIDEETRVAEAARTGKVSPQYREVDLGANDASRAKAEFVVEYAEDVCADTRFGRFELCVKARRLSAKGKYDPEGELIRFNLRELGDDCLKKKDIEITRRMKMMFV